MRGYVKIDDSIDEHPKLLEVGPLAAWAYISSITYCNRNLTDGFVPAQKGAILAGSDQTSDKLVSAGLWEAVEGGYRVRDYLGHQRSKAEILQLREDRRAAGSLGGKASTRAKDKHLLKQNPSKPQAEQEQEQELSTKTPSVSPEIPAESSAPSGVVDVYDHWRVQRGKSHGRYTKISAARRGKIQSRLREFTIPELCLAIDGVAYDPWADRSMHDDLTVIFRSREQVERFLEFRAAANGNGNGKPPAGETTEAFRARIAAIDAQWRETAA